MVGLRSEQGPRVAERPAVFYTHQSNIGGGCSTKTPSRTPCAWQTFAWSCAATRRHLGGSSTRLSRTASRSLLVQDYGAGARRRATRAGAGSCLVRSTRTCRSATRMLIIHVFRASTRMLAALLRGRDEGLRGRRARRHGGRGAGHVALPEFYKRRRRLLCGNLHAIFMISARGRGGAGSSPLHRASG